MIQVDSVGTFRMPGEKAERASSARTGKAGPSVGVAPTNRTERGCVGVQGHGGGTRERLSGDQERFLWTLQVSWFGIGVRYFAMFG